MPRQMHLMAYLKTGPTAMHTGAWRHPQADLHDIFSPSRYAHIARVLEDAYRAMWRRWCRDRAGT